LKKGENVNLYAISVDPPDVSKDFAGKIASDGEGKVNFPLLSDPQHKIIDAYGLRDPLTKDRRSMASRIQRFMSSTKRDESPGPRLNRIIASVLRTRRFAQRWMR